MYVIIDRMGEPKKVLVFSVTYYPKFVGGAEVAVKEITDRIKDREYEFHMVTLRLDKSLPREEKIGNVFIYRVGFSGNIKNAFDSIKFPLQLNKYFFPFLAAWKALKLHKQNNFALVWSIMANYAGFGALLFKMLKPQIPLLLTLQEGDPIDYIRGRVLPVYPFFRQIFKRADVIQAISRYLSDFGVSMGFKGDPLVVPNGVDIKKFNIEISKEEKLKIREKLGLKKDDFALITASRLVVKNGVGDVIQALPKLPGNVKFLVFGEGQLKRDLKNLADTLHVSERVFWGGFVSHDDLPRYLQVCDIFIRPSLSEGFGNSFVEAMAAGLPVIATPVGGIVDFLFEGRTGYFCQPEDSGSIAEAVRKVMADPNKNKVTENALRMVKEKYDWGIISLQMKEIFNRTAKI